LLRQSLAAICNGASAAHLLVGLVHMRNNMPMTNDNNSGQGLSSASNRTVRITAIAIIAAVVLVTPVVFSYVRVCNQEVTDTGKIVEVCRHLDATDPPMIAAGLVVIALLGVFYTEISGFGLSLKRDVARAANKAEQATNVAEDARQAAQSARSTAEAAQSLSSAQPSNRARAESFGMFELEQAINKMAEEYKTTRSEMPSGNARTARMTRIVSNMISRLKGVSPGPLRRALLS
jgi:hypothetical protein